MPHSLNTLDLEVKPDWTSLFERGYRRGMGSEDPTRQQFGLRLQTARRRKGLTQQLVADLFGVKKGTVSAWETGGGDPGVFVLRQLAKLYEATADSLLWDDVPSSDAMKIAVQYDHLSSEKRARFDAIWMTHFVEAASDVEVEKAFAAKSAGKYKAPAAQKSDEGSTPLVNTGPNVKETKSRNVSKRETG